MEVMRDGTRATLAASVVTVGTFDGVHLAHQVVLARLRQEAAARALPAAVVTFDPHPQQVLHSRPGEVRVLTTLDERLALLEAEGVACTVVIAFTPAFADTPAERFVTELLVGRLGARCIVVGHDHGFGRGRQGDLELLERLGARHGFAVVPMDALVLDGAPVSSTRIRTALEAGRVEEAARLLGRPYALTGRVVRGDGRGATLGFPTANLAPPPAVKLVPADGVYAARAAIDGVDHAAMVNVGVRPTIGAGGPRTIEAHLLGVAEELYGREITLRFVARVRAERRFAALADLAAQLRADRETVARLLAADEAGALHAPHAGPKQDW